MIYLDNQTASKPHPEVVQAMLPYFQKEWGSICAPHQMSYALMPSLKESLEHIYALVGANKEDHFVFTSSGAEAVNHAIFSTYMSVTRKTGKNHFLATTLSEAPTILSLERLREMGCFHDLTSQITKDAVIEAITPRTALLSISWADGLTGIVHDLKEIAEVCKQRGVLFHVDATHLLGKGRFYWEECGADFLTFNAEQMNGPKGCGGLFVKAKLEIAPLIVGGKEQAGLRGGSFNVPLFVGLAKAAQIALSNADSVALRCAYLRGYFEEMLLEKVPHALVLFPHHHRLPHLTTIHFPGVTSDALLYLLNKKGVYASLGGGNYQQIAYLLQALRVESQGSLSFSFSSEISEEEIKRAVDVIADSYLSLRKCSQHIVGDA